jgi:hypothetical protein
MWEYNVTEHNGFVTSTINRISVGAYCKILKDSNYGNGLEEFRFQHKA